MAQSGPKSGQQTYFGLFFSPFGVKDPILAPFSLEKSQHGLAGFPCCVWILFHPIKLKIGRPGQFVWPITYFQLILATCLAPLCFPILGLFDPTRALHCSPLLWKKNCEKITSSSSPVHPVLESRGLARILGKSTSRKKYQVECGTFSLGKSTILVLFPIGTFSYIIGKRTIIFQ